MTIGEAFAAYDFEMRAEGKKEKTRKNYQVAFNSFQRAIGDVPVQFITTDTINIWKLEMQNRGNVPSSMRTNLIKLRAVLEYVRRRGADVIDPKHVTLPKLVKRPPTWLEHDEVKLLLDQAKNPRDRAIIACLFSTGCRISELLKLNREDVANGKTEVEICGKGDKYRHVYFDPKARFLLDEYLKKRKDSYEPLFISGQRARITVSRVQQIIHNCAEEAGMSKRVTPHVFRHSYASDLVVNGAPIAIVQKLLGHSNIQTTMIYTHVNTSEEKQVYQQFHSS